MSPRLGGRGVTALLGAALAVLLVASRPLAAARQQPPGVDLHLAALRGDLEGVRRHIAAGTDLDARDRYGSTPLIIAATFGRVEVARALIEAGVDLEIANDDGATPLYIAAFLCRVEIVRALLDGGADRYARDHEGQTPFDAVAAPFEDARGIYDLLGEALGPLGLQLDYEQIRRTRPRIAAMLHPRAEDLERVEYAPLPGADWSVSTPREEGLDPALVAELYLDAAELSTLNGVLVVKNGRLIAEGYFNDGGVERKNVVQSVTKSYTSALVGIALDRGCLASLDQRMMDFFPELAGRITDPRKERITIRQLLQMRAGYPWEEREPPYAEILFATGDLRWLPHLVDFPLSNDPGTGFGYSNLTSHILGIIVARACDTTLESFAERTLFAPLGAQLGSWTRDADGYNFGSFEISVTPRDMAKFGLLYLRGGEYEGTRVLPADWVGESLQAYSTGMWDDRWRRDSDNYMGPYLRNIAYGYQWWSARVGEHRFDFAWGHGGNLIVLLHDLDMLVVTAADPLYRLGPAESWEYEGAILQLVGKFIASLPSG